MIGGQTKYPKYHKTVVHMLHDAAIKFPSAIALVYKKQELNYKDYFRCVMGLSQHLISMANLKTLKGQRVAVICSNSIDMAISLFAVHAAGAQVVPINPIYTTREITFILNDSDPTIVIFDKTIETIVLPIINRLKIRYFIKVDEENDMSFDIWPNKEDADIFPMPEPEDLATLQYTGGTTGSPKGVNITHGQISINITQREVSWPTIEGQEKILCVMPLFHVFATSMALYLSAFSKGQMHILKRYHPELVLREIENTGITLLPVGPSIFHGLMNCEIFNTIDFSTLRIAYSGSAPLPDITLQRWEKATGCIILEGYGQTEAGPLVSANFQGSEVIVGSVGKALIDTEIEIVDVETGKQILDINQKGEIRVKGPQIMSGYRNNKAETDEALRNGWLYTGDIGEFDEDGNLFILDRKKDMVITGGYNVYPREIEEILYNHTDIIEAAVIGVADEYKGQVLHGFVTVNRRSKIKEGEILNYCRLELAEYKIPKSIFIVDQIPRTTIGKIDKKALKEFY